MPNKLSFALTSGGVDPALDKLFSSSLAAQAPKARKIRATEPPRKRARLAADDAETTSSGSESDSGLEAASTGSSISSDDEDGGDSNSIVGAGLEDSSREELEDASAAAGDRSRSERRKRKKQAEGTDLEELYLTKIAREDENRKREAKKLRTVRDKDSSDQAGNEDIKEQSGAETDSGPDGSESDDGMVDVTADSEDDDYEIPKHETQDGSAGNAELNKAARTVFLGNVSSNAIRSKEVIRQLKAHLSSFFGSMKTASDSEPRIESIRFRSVAFATTSIPRKAAFAKKELMDATTRSTNAYVVYSSAAAAREAVKQLNGTVVLGRHMRVDGVAHPSPVDHRRCVFVGNLGFVDDESLIRAAQEESEDEDDENEEDGDGEGSSKPSKKKRKRSSKAKEPSDIEEGLWRTFGTVGPVEGVRVVRDKTTRVGKGIAYVQFKDDVAIEHALQLDGKAFPPLLPRQLRVTRAKKPSKTNNAVQLRQQQQQRSSRRSDNNGIGRSNVYNPRPDLNASTMSGRAAKLLGRAGAAQARKAPRDGLGTGARSSSGSVSAAAGDVGAGTGQESPLVPRPPESFVVFEGHRASQNSGSKNQAHSNKKRTRDGTADLNAPLNMKPIKSGIRHQKNSKKKSTGGGKPTSRSSRRGAAFKAAGGRG